ncbi:MAG TPA: ATP-binding cassette domain-containing protein [Mycobacteriales bacterium]|jgi:ABC-type branched-subunit amino acid transport system ATPase component/ABC-type branched-subunit amino acid transport system permease subunit|nr:ATP-binding cassette domain-containing protein [Mycobacteriales bacterium]
MSATTIAQARRLLQRPANRVGAQALATAAVIALAAFIAAQSGFGTPLPYVVLGAITGMTYGLLAVGLVLIYRTNRIINFAHGQIGAFGSALFGLGTVSWGVPYWVAFPLALLLAATTGAVAEAGVVRRLRKAPRLMSIVATLGVGQFLVVFALVINSQATAGSLFPQPPGLPTFTIGALRITPAYTGMLVLCPLSVVLIACFLKFSKYGLAMRAAAANPEAARMAGVFAGRMSSLAWAIAGTLSALTAILTAPTQGFLAGDSFGPELLLRAMTGAVVARMSNLPQAFMTGIGLGVIEQVLLFHYPQSNLVEMVLFVIILGTLLLQRQRGGRDEEKGSWAAVQAWRPVPEQLRRIWLVRNLGLMVGIVALIAAGLLPLVINNEHSVVVTEIIGTSIIGLSIGILTGLGGQLTLGQVAIASIGAVVSFQVSRASGDFPLALIYAGLVSGAVSVLIGLPSLRIRGLMLTVTTLSFALATPAWLLPQSWMLGSGKNPGRPIVFGHALDTGRLYYPFAFGLLLVALVLARNVRRSGFGRLLVAIRDNEDNARAFTVRASLVKVQGYVVAGFLAGIGGAVYAHAIASVDGAAFSAQASIDVVAMTVIGGVSILAGPILGALYVLGIPAFVPLDTAGLAATKLGALLLILYLPGGLAQLLLPLRDRTVRWLGRRNGLDVEAIYADDPADADDAPSVTAVPAQRPAVLDDALRQAPVAGRKLLEARNLRKRFGGVVAVDDVSFVVRAGETVGLIGPNGAGKTTTFELLGGFTRPDSGRVLFDKRDVSALGPEDRAKLGMIRSFQDAALFPTMTVTESVMLALERTQPTSFFRSVAGWSFGERTKERQAREIVSFMGLDRYRDKQTQELSTGTRRITEIACLMALQPTLLLLDEPSSGVAQRETEALGALLAELKRQLDLTLVVIEHDIPLIMGISDRIIAMADGKVISHGTPDAVRNDPVVVESYLGGSLTAIERSGPAAPRRRKSATVSA